MMAILKRHKHKLFNNENLIDVTFIWLVGDIHCTWLKRFLSPQKIVAQYPEERWKRRTTEDLVDLLSCNIFLVFQMNNIAYCIAKYPKHKTYFIEAKKRVV